MFFSKKNILENINFNSFEIQNVETLYLGKEIENNFYAPDDLKIPDCKDKIYNRFMFPIKFNKEGDIFLFRNYLSILEGFYFENDVVDKIIVEFNENKVEIPKVGDYFLNRFPILLDCLSYTQINFKFYKDGNVVDVKNGGGKMIGGFLPEKINFYNYKNDIVEYSLGSLILNTA